MMSALLGLKSLTEVELPPETAIFFPSGHTSTVFAVSVFCGKNITMFLFGVEYLNILQPRAQVFSEFTTTNTA